MANQQLNEYSATLEAAVLDRTVELSNALEKAEAASTTRSRFVATMSHEIRTPLGGLLGMIELLTNDETNPSKLELLKYAHTSGEALNRIVNDVLDFSKMDAGVFVFEEEHVDIRALSDSIMALTRSNPKGAGRTILTKIDRSVPPLFLGDATRIHQVISNLVSNALRYSIEGPVILRAKAMPAPNGVLLRVEVEDFGIGIESDQIDNLFKDFSQISTSLTAAAQGTGLGLAICKRIVEGCGGVIGVESTPQSGSTFWFELPVEIPTDQPMAQSEPITNKDLPHACLDGRRVLLAEDNIINQKLLLTYLRRMNIKVDLAENGRVAIEKFAPGKYDLILMDVAMPEVDGLDATRQINERWNAQDIPPILVLTAHVMDAIQDKAASVGIKTVLCKPIPYEDLKSAIEVEIANQQTNVAHASAITKDVDDAASLCSLMSDDTAQQLLETFSITDLTNLVLRYVQDAESILDKMATLYDEEEREYLRAQAHSLKGSSLSLGFTQIAALAFEIEQSSTDIEATKMAEIVKVIADNLTTISACATR
ncbi:ATP-binding protein [Yoonia maritima]|nr:ATP-binding protein [Yoonia maritima]